MIDLVACMLLIACLLLIITVVQILQFFALADIATALKGATSRWAAPAGEEPTGR